MLRLAGFHPTAPVVLSVAVLLAGCGGGGPFPDAQSAPAQVRLARIQGSDFGGHAAIVGGHVYLLQAGTCGAGAKATSLLSSSYTSSSPTAQDTVSAIPAYGMYYATTDSLGYFNISGDYACTAGYPVYLYASGGDLNTTKPVQITGASAAPDAAGMTFNVSALNLTTTYAAASLTGTKTQASVLANRAMLGLWPGRAAGAAEGAGGEM